MTDLLRLLFLVPLGFIAAVLAAALTILAGWFGHQAGDIFTDFETTGYVIGTGVLVVLQIGALAALPAVVVIVLAEVFTWRSVFFYIAIGGGLGLLASQFNGMLQETNDSPILLPAAGFVGGLAYWLIAGRLAGVAPRPPAAPTSAP